MTSYSFAFTACSSSWTECKDEKSSGSDWPDGLIIASSGQWTDKWVIGSENYLTVSDTVVVGLDLNERRRF